jgi:hypothetical protein
MPDRFGAVNRRGVAGQPRRVEDFLYTCGKESKASTLRRKFSRAFGSLPNAI